MWLIDKAVLHAMQEAIASGIKPTANQQAEFDAIADGSVSAQSSRIMTVAGNTAEIAITGILTNTPDFMAFLFGGGNTTYSEIVGAISLAEQDDSINDVTFRIESPGGQFAGLFTAIDAIKSMTKPTKAVIVNLAASAAYGLAAQADSIEVINRATRVGDVGVVGRFRLDETVVEIASTEAPNKRPDVQTVEGLTVVKEQLDAMHQLFAEAIADGRNTTIELVNKNFGRGASILAKEALGRGMIDSIADAPPAVVGETTAMSGNKNEVLIMDRNQFKLEHGALFEAVKNEGKDGEKDRILAHLTMGEASGDMKTALAAIKDDSEMTAALQATYMAAGMNRSDVDTRTDEEKALAAADGAGSDDNVDTAADEVASAVEAQLGVEVEA